MPKGTAPSPKKTTPSGKATTTRSTTTSSSVPMARRLQRYESQKASIEGKRAYKPLIKIGSLKYGENLSAAQRTRIQRRLYLSFAGVMLAAAVLVIAYGILNVNVLEPARTMVTVNGTNIPQYNYRYEVAYLAQDEWNKLQADLGKQTTLQSQLSKTPAPTNATDLNAQLTAAQADLNTQETAFTQTSVDQLAINTIIEDQLIQHGMTNFQKSDPKGAAGLNVTSKQIDDAFTAFKKAFPAGETYSTYKSQDHLNDDNVKYAIAITLRRNAMDTYLQSLVVSPTKQVHLLRIQVDNKTKAQQDLTAITSKKSTFADLAKSDSLDVNSKGNGGDAGWIVQGQQDQAIEQWAFDPSRKAGELGPVIKDVSGTYNIVQIVEVDPSRVVSADTLSSLKGNALGHWLTGQRDLPPNKISSYDQGMYTSTNNVQTVPSYSANPGAQATSTPDTSGQPIVPGSTSP